MNSHLHEFIECNLQAHLVKYRGQFFEITEQIEQAFEQTSLEYFALPTFDQELEQRWITRAFLDKPWPQLLGKPVSRNLSTLYSLDVRSFISILPAFLVTSFFDLDTFHATTRQLLPGTTDFYERIEFMSASQHEAIRSWLVLMTDYNELPFMNELHCERFCSYWNFCN